jgi:preprotein translocase subunit SecE
MADDTDQNETPDSGAKPAKRRLRSNTETVRERTEKIQLQQQKLSDKPKRAGELSALWRGFTWAPRKLGRGIAKLERFKLFRIIGRILLPRYIRNSWRELRQVTWPDRRTSLRLTYAVVIFSIIFGLVVAGVDYVINILVKLVLDKV